MCNARISCGYAGSRWSRTAGSSYSAGLPWSGTLQRKHHRAAPRCPEAAPGGEPLQRGCSAAGCAAAGWQRRLSRPPGEVSRHVNTSQAVGLHSGCIECCYYECCSYTKSMPALKLLYTETAATVRRSGSGSCAICKALLTPSDWTMHYVRLGCFRVLSS